MYDKFPFIEVSPSDADCTAGWSAIGRRLREETDAGPRFVCVECYPGVFEHDLREQLSASVEPSLVISTEEFLLSAAVLDKIFASVLTDDPVFGVFNDFRLEQFFDAEKLEHARQSISRQHEGRVLIVGTGAAMLAPPESLMVYADLARWEIQQRQRRNQIGNFGADNADDLSARKYKRAFFLDWRAADRLKRDLLPAIHFLLDTHKPASPLMIPGDALREGLRKSVQRPFRVVPFFDPGPWGGHWMEKVFDLPRDVPNYAWCFDCVPEENSLLLGFGTKRIEIPCIDLVFAFPEELLGKSVYARFGADFPIRFDFLDSVGGGNLSLQVHPMNDYAREHFGLSYTQDESYYLLDAVEGATVYLGLKDGMNPLEMASDLEAAQSGGSAFEAERYVNKWPARKHDHFLIPAGTVHCSGRGALVLEISATPYIFTFKLWDWGRLGLDGRPRPIHLERGIESIQWNRTTKWVEESLINQVQEITSGPGWREERTGLHSLQFIETRRHWFADTVHHSTNGTVNVLNLVEGEEAIVESPANAFPPLIIHYAETFIVPASVGRYTIRPYGSAIGKHCATVKAFVRE